MLPSRLVQAVYTAALLSSSLYGQTTTGTLLGTVSDPDNAAVPGAVVELRNLSTGLAMRTNTGAEGIFRFNSLAPATYDLTVTAAAGFKAYRQSRIEVTANEVRDLGRITLELGALTEQVSVTATTSPIQTASAENSKLIDSSQMQNITLKGRDMFGMLVIVPGVTVTQRDTTSENTVGSVRINGAAYASAPTSPWTASPTWIPGRTGPRITSRTWIRSPKCGCSPAITRRSTAATPTE